MDWIHSFFTKIPSLQTECDVSDRLSSTVSVTIICVMAAAITMKQIIGHSIACYCPTDFTPGQEIYVENLCWVMNTYYLPGTEVPRNIEDRKKAEISYYQWVPYILLLQALLFYLPYFVWSLLNWQCGIHVSKVVRMAIQVENWQTGEATGIQMVSSYLSSLFLNRKRDEHDCCGGCKSQLARLCLYCGKRYGSALTMIYFFTKLLYLANVFGQVFLMQKFLLDENSNYTLWGIQAISELSNDRNWQQTGVFPRLTLCDFELRRYANVHRYTVQCVLPINLFSEKIYIFLWFWCCFVAGVGMLNLLIWLYRMGCRGQRIGYVKGYLRMLDPRRRGRKFKVELEHFVEGNLRYDGVLLLRLIDTCAGDAIVAKLVGCLWKTWRKDKRGGAAAEEHEDTETEADEMRRSKPSLAIAMARAVSPTSITSRSTTSKNDDASHSAVSNV